jgi:hypothetical protein
MKVQKAKAPIDARMTMAFAPCLLGAALLTQSAICMAETQSAIDSHTAPMPGPRLGSSLFSSEPQVRGNRVVRSIQSNGVVAFGDQVDAGAKEVKTIQYMSYSSPESLRKAQQERDYWLRQSEALRQRQAARDRELESARQARQQEAALALLAQAQAENYYTWRPVVGLRNFPPTQISGVAPVYVGSPGLAGTAGGFLSSGFAGRR